MPRNNVPNVTAEMVEADCDAVAGLKTLAGYLPPHAGVSIEAAVAAVDRLRQAEEKITLATTMLGDGRDERAVARWELRAIMLNIKMAVTIQYGPSSNEIRVLGLKRKSDYRRPSRRRMDADAA